MSLYFHPCIRNRTSLIISIPISLDIDILEDVLLSPSRLQIITLLLHLRVFLLNPFKFTIICVSSLLKSIFQQFNQIQVVRFILEVQFSHMSEVINHLLRQQLTQFSQIDSLFDFRDPLELDLTISNR